MFTNLALLACGSCQITRLVWMTPSFFLFVKALIFAMLAYVLATGLEENGGQKAITSLIALAVAFVGSMAMFPMLILPLMLMVILFLLAKLASERRNVKIVAIIGLLPFLMVLLWPSKNNGRFSKLDNPKIQLRRISHFAPQIAPEFEVGYLLEALAEDSERVRDNAAVILKRKIEIEKDPKQLERIRQELERLAARPGKHPYVEETLEVCLYALSSSSSTSTSEKTPVRR